MNNFTFCNTTRIVFGRGTELKAGEEAARLATRVLIHYGSERVKQSGLFGRVKESLEKAGLAVFELGGVAPNPRVSLVRTGIALCRKERIDLILALGGGSTIDSSKAIAAGVPYAGDVWDFFEYTAAPEKALKVATILTIPAAGSESSDSCVISNEEKNLKRGLTSSLLYPAFSILNPELCMTLPPFQIGAGASDILAHMMERYFTPTAHVELTDRMLEAVMRNLISVVPRLLKAPGNYDLWAEYMLTGTIAHNNSLDVGRTTDWASHGIEHEVSAIYDVAHGAGLAVVFPAWMQHVYRTDTARFTRWAVEVWGVEQNYADPDETALAGIEALKSFSESIGMPVSLDELGVPPDRFQEMAKKATGGDAFTIGGFKKLTSADVLCIYKYAL